MQKPSPIQNNQNVLPLRPTMPNPLDFTNQLQVYNYDVPHKLTGYVSPTGVGNFSILDADGNPLFLPAVSMVTAVGLVATGPVVPAAGSVTISVGATAVTGAITSSGANTGYLAAPTTATTVTTKANVSVTTTVGFTAGTSLLINVFYIELA